MKTIMAKPATVEKKWYIIDAEGKALGRVASEAAKLLRGKHKPSFTPNVDCGDNVIILNSDKLILTGKKRRTKIFQEVFWLPIWIAFDSIQNYDERS